jgi:hypothetical protein
MQAQCLEAAAFLFDLLKLLPACIRQHSIDGHTGS